ERTLWVGNLGPDVTADLLTELFLQSGPLECPVKLVAGKDGKNGYAFVTFKHEESVLYACRLFRSLRLCGAELLVKPRQGSGHERQWQEILPTERLADRERADRAAREARSDHRRQHQRHRQLPQPPMPPPPPPSFPLLPPPQLPPHQRQHQQAGNFLLPPPPPLPPPVVHHQQHHHQQHHQHHQQHQQHQHHHQQHHQNQRHHHQHGIKRSTSDSGFNSHYGRNKQARF
ncbi:hypothetical protein BOX15_Mlig005032g1, partial [Macrostomum lignano]